MSLLGQDLIPEQLGAALGSRQRSTPEVGGAQSHLPGTVSGRKPPSRVREGGHDGAAPATVRAAGPPPSPRCSAPAASPDPRAGGAGAKYEPRRGATRGGCGSGASPGWAAGLTPTRPGSYLSRPWHGRNPRDTFYSLISLPNWNSWCWQFPPRPRGPRSPRIAFCQWSAGKQNQTTLSGKTTYRGRWGGRRTDRAGRFDKQILGEKTKMARHQLNKPWTQRSYNTAAGTTFSIPWDGRRRE